MHPKNIFPLFSLLLTLFTLTAPALSVSQSIDDPSSISELKVKITQYGTITVSEGDLKWAKINISIPAQTAGQALDTDISYKTTPEGNNIYIYSIDNPDNTIRYSIESTVTVYGQPTTSIPESYTIPKEITQYTTPTGSIQSDNQQIISQAKEITKDSETDFEKISALATWVYNNVDYQLEYGTTSNDALWTLENKKGTCDEFATLFIALTRSLGIPARYISGYAYGNDGWEKHAFAEVYLGIWIPVDPTWNEIGSLDATHIRFATKSDNIIKNEVQAYGTSIGEIRWVEDETDIEIISMDTKGQYDYELKKSATILKPGEEAIVLLRFTPEEYKTVNLDLEPCISSTPIVEIENQEQTITLTPGEEKIAYWKIKVSDNLRRNMEYTCPLTMNSRDLSLRSINLTINTASQPTETATIIPELEKPELILGEEESIDITVQKTGGKQPITIGIITGDTLTEYEFSKGIGEVEKYSLAFTPEKSGESEVIIYSSTGEIQTLAYIVKKAGDIYIDNIEIPAYAETGIPFTITTTIKNSRTTAENIRFKADFEGETDIQALTIKGTEQLTTTFSPTTTGTAKVAFRLEGTGIDAATTRSLTVYAVPEISLGTSYDYEKEKATITVTSEKDTAEKITITINTLTKQVNSPESTETIEFDLPVGTHEAKITYTDKGGNTHETTETITIKDPGFIQKIILYIKRLLR